jgi:excisionase family DNA binding protein
MENLIASEEAAKALGVEVATVYSWVARRKIPFVKVGAALRFRPLALQAWLQQREYSPKPAEADAQLTANGMRKKARNSYSRAKSESRPETTGEKVALRLRRL